MATSYIVLNGEEAKSRWRPLENRTAHHMVIP